MLRTGNAELEKLVTDEVSTLGYILWGIEVVPTRYSCLVRVYIESGEELKSVGIEDCTRVNRQLSLCLDSKSYVIEVSSPGLARRFFKPEQYANYIGERVHIRTKTLVNGRRNFNGSLVACDAQTVSLTDSEEPEALHNFPYAQIEKGRLDPDYQTLFKK